MITAASRQSSVPRTFRPWWQYAFKDQMITPITCFCRLLILCTALCGTALLVGESGPHHEHRLELTLTLCLIQRSEYWMSTGPSSIAHQHPLRVKHVQKGYAVP